MYLSPVDVMLWNLNFATFSNTTFWFCYVVLLLCVCVYSAMLCYFCTWMCVCVCVFCIENTIQISILMSTILRDIIPLSSSGHYMYRTVVTICTTSLTFTIPRSAHTAVFVCFVWISEQTAIISLYNINWLVFITEMECVYCAVRTGYLYICVCVCIYIYIYMYIYIYVYN